MRVDFAAASPPAPLPVTASSLLPAAQRTCERSRVRARSTHRSDGADPRIIVLAQVTSYPHDHPPLSVRQHRMKTGKLAGKSGVDPRSFRTRFELRRIP